MDGGDLVGVLVIVIFGGLLLELGVRSQSSARVALTRAFLSSSRSGSSYPIELLAVIEGEDLDPLPKESIVKLGEPKASSFLKMHFPSRHFRM